MHRTSGETGQPARHPRTQRRASSGSPGVRVSSLVWLVACCAIGCSQPEQWTPDSCCGATRTLGLSDASEAALWLAGGDLDAVPTTSGLRLTSRGGAAFLSRPVSLPPAELARLEIALSLDGTIPGASSPLRASIAIQTGNRMGLLLLAGKLVLAGRFRESLSSLGYALRGLQRIDATATHVVPGETAGQIQLVADFGTASWELGPAREIRLDLVSGRGDVTLSSVDVVPLPAQGLHRVGREWRPCRRALRADFALPAGRPGERMSVELTGAPG